MLEDDLDEDCYLEPEQQTEDDLDEHVYAFGPVGQNSVANGKMTRSSMETEKSPGGCIQLVQLGTCKRAGCKYVHNDPAVLQATWWYYVRRFFDSPYRASKAKVLEAYKDLPTKVTMLSRVRNSSTAVLLEKSDCLDDPIFEDSPHVVEMLMKSAFPEVEYIDKIHRSGEVVLYGEPSIHVCRALFDTGALSANYISQELVDKHRGSLGSCIRRAKGHVCLGDNETTVEVSETLVVTVRFVGQDGTLHSADLRFVVFSMPGLDMIIGLKDIVRHFKSLFVEMLEEVQDNLGGQLKLMADNNIEITLPGPEKESEEELLTPDPCSFSGPLHYLNIGRDEALKEYEALFDSHISPEFNADEYGVRELLLSDEAKEVFVPGTWEGVKDIPEIHLDFRDTLPTSMRPRARPVNPRLFEAASTEVQRMRKYIYEPWDSPIVSTLVIAPKATKPFIRFCGDYVEINKHIARNHYPIPKVIHMLEKCVGFSIFLDLDMTNSFHQMKLDMESSLKLAVQTPWGLFRPRFLPEGIAPASQLLQKTVCNVFSDYMDWMVVIFDNFLVLCHDYADARRKLELVIRRCHERGLVLKFAKSWLGFKKVNFFGYEVSYGKYQLTKERIEEVCSMPMPTSQKKMQRFLGAALFFKGFIPNYSAIAAPLHEMCKNNFNWNPKTWERDFVKDFMAIKEQLRNATTIYFPDYDLDWVLRVDASDDAAAGVLMQRKKHEDKEQWQPIAFVSRKFTEQAKRWDTPKKEGFALFYGVFSLSYYLRGKAFVLETDHRNWVYIEKSQVPMIIS